MCKTNKDLWIFGYGSLIWKVDFPIVEKKTGFIKGYLRRFYQNSIDHRGTNENPGRVVTLIPSSDSESKVWGMCYRIHDKDKQNVLEHLDYREKNGYTRHSIKFYPKSFTKEKYDETPIDIILYLAKSDNVSYAGFETNLENIVEQIFNAEGQSGKNRDYVHQLAKAMREYFPEVIDEHLSSIESLLIQKEKFTTKS